MMKLLKIVLDFETYYAKDYSLSKKDTTTSLYIRDPRFRVHGVGLKIEDKPAVWVTAGDVKALFTKLPWHRIMVIGHNLKFDASILKIHYDVVPALMLDTMAMARALFGSSLASFSLDSISQVLAGKGKNNYGLVQTMDQYILSPELERQLAAYCISDCELTYKCCQAMWKHFPINEVPIVDWTIRMFTEPMLLLNKERLLAFRDSVLLKKQELLESLENKYEKDVFTSNPKFAKVLTDLGIQPPTKISPTTGKETYAFAKTDEEFLALQEHEILEVALVTQARMGIKTSIMETRALSYANHADHGPWPVDIGYCGALTTHRFSGGKGAGGNCVSGDTEVLTKSGWIRLDQIEENTLVATWSAKFNTIQWEPAKVIRIKYNGIGIHIKTLTGTHDVLYTPDHRIPWYPSDDSTLKVRTAKFLSEHKMNLRLPTSSYYIGGTNKASEFHVRFIVAFQADGSIAGNTIRFEFMKDRKKDRFEWILSKLQLDWRSRDFEKCGSIYTRYTVYSANAYFKFKFFGPWILNLNSQNLKILVNETAYWDSYIRDSSWQYYTIHRENAEWLATAAHLVNKSAMMQHGLNNGGKSKLWTVNIKPRPYIFIEKKRKCVSEVQLDQDMYCLSTQADGFIARRNDAIFLTKNCQNLGRDKEAIKSASNGVMLPAVKAELRRCIYAPEGHVILVGDSTGIELRVAMMFAQQTEALDIIRSGGDLYCWFASQLFGRPITKADKTERFLGKEACLSLQYQSGAEKFRKTAGLKGVVISPEEARNIVMFYRGVMYRVPQLWKILTGVIMAMYRGEDVSIPPAHITSTGTDKFLAEQFNVTVPAIHLPGGLNLRYPGLRKDSNEQWVYMTRTFRKEHETKIYGGKLMENICQALAGRIIAEQAAILHKYMPVVMAVHDELVSVVRVEDAEMCKKIMLEVMSTPPKWWPDLPVNAEVNYAQIYGEAK